jgi:hypothetical protein
MNKRRASVARDHFATRTQLCNLRMGTPKCGHLRAFYRLRASGLSASNPGSKNPVDR